MANKMERSIGFRVLGSRVLALGFRVQGLRSRFFTQGLGFSVEKDQGLQSAF